jgi:hypothetical protein
MGKTSMPSQVSGRQHHVPEFYLSAWAGSDGRICVVSNYGGNISRNRHPPKHTGFEYHLYSYNEKFLGDDRAEVETKFFSRLDDEGAKIVSKFVNGDTLGEKEKTLWAQFISGFRVRTPTNIDKLKNMAAASFAKEFAAGQNDYAALKQADDPATLHEWVNLHHPGYIDNIAVAQIPKIISRSDVLQDILAMSWFTVAFKEASNPLMTSDRPLIMTAGLQNADCIIALPLSLRCGFFAFRPDSHAEKALKSTPISRLAKALNDNVVRQAEKYAYCAKASDAPDVFFQRKLKPIAMNHVQ